MRALTEKECIELGVNPQHCGTNFEEYHQEQMKDPEFRKEYEKLQLQRRVAKAIVNRREAQRLSQRELARRANTTQAVISRIENGNVSVGLQMLQRIADALGTQIDIVLR